MLNKKFNEEEIIEIQYGSGIYDENDNEIFSVIQQKVVYSDMEKSSITTEYVIKETATGKYYQANLTSSLWYGQTKANTKVVWREVTPYETTILGFKLV